MFLNPEPSEEQGKTSLQNQNLANGYHNLAHFIILYIYDVIF